VTPGQRQRLEQARVHQHQGRLRAAGELLRPLLVELPDDGDVLESAGRVEMLRGNHEMGERHLRRAVAKHPGRHTAWRAIAQCRRFQDDIEGATEAIDHALAIEPNDPASVAQRVELLVLQGRDDEAAAIVEPRIDGGERHPALVMNYAVLAPEIGREERASEVLAEGIGSPGTPPAARTQFRFRRGALLERLGRFDEAFACWREANAALPQAPPGRVGAVLDRVVEWWTPARYESMEPAAVDGSFAVFIVGMPRSGTSLTEQILSMHPGVHAGGERRAIPNVDARFKLLPPRELDAETREAAAAMLCEDMRAADPDAALVTDKLPSNFFLLPLLARLVPGMKVVHCVRDPLDTCVSCFTNNFMRPLPFTNDLRSLGTYFRKYERVMEHWTAMGIEMHELVYERLVTEPESEIRKLLGFLGLGFDEACLRPHESTHVTFTASTRQVRNPINARSIGRHTRFAKHLGPLEAALGCG